MNDGKSPFKKLFMLGILAEKQLAISLRELLKKVTKDYFRESYLYTIGFDFFITESSYEDEKIHFQIWLIGAFDYVKPTFKIYTSGAQAILLVYDINSIESLEVMESWLEEFADILKEKVTFMYGCQLTKSDTTTNFIEKGNMLAEKYGISKPLKTHNFIEDFESLLEIFAKTLDKKG